MLSNFLVSLEAVFPMFVIMGLGALVKYLGLITEEEAKKVNKVIFKVGFPCLMFTNLYGNSLEEALNVKVMVFVIVMIAIIYIISTIITLSVEKDPKTRGAMIQAMFRSNFVIIGTPLVRNIFGDGNLALTALLLAIVIPIYNVLAVVTLEAYRGGKPNFIKIAKAIVTNPLIIGGAFGLLCVLLKIEVPGFILSPIKQLSSMTTPMALLILGASFSFQSIKTGKRNLILSVAGRLVIMPSIALITAVLLGFRDITLITLVGLFASPCAVAGFSMAQEMESDYELAGNCIIFTSMFSCATMFIWIFVFKCMGLF